MRTNEKNINLESRQTLQEEITKPSKILDLSDITHNLASIWRELLAP